MPIQIDAALLREISRKNLRYVSDDIKGISRKKAGKSFVYFDPNGVRIHNQNTIERINELAIPPAWEQVWVSPYQHSHLQATGVDAKGRKQYIYHEEWTKICQEHKFDHLLSFCKVLPDIRKQVNVDLRLPTLERRRVLATVVWLLEHTFIRVGNEEYAQENDSFGLTTLRNKHVEVRGKKARFSFVGKSHVEHKVEIVNPMIIKTIRQCLELPGYELFQYFDDEEKRHQVDSGQVNEYLQNMAQIEVTAKDFRTWGGTLLSAQTLYKLGPYQGEDSLKTNLSQAVEVVSKHLRNTPNVCRQYYIHPTVFETYKKNVLVDFIKKHVDQKYRSSPQLSTLESSVVRLLHQS